MVKAEIVKIVLNYKGWFNIHTHVSLPLQSNISDKTNISIDASTAKWFVTSALADAKGNVITEYDPEQEKEVPVLHDFLFNCKLEGNASFVIQLDEESGYIKGEVTETPNDCTFEGYCISHQL